MTLKAHGSTLATAAIGLLGAATMLASSLSSGCSPASPRMFWQEAIVRVESDPGVPLASAAVLFDGKRLTETNVDGSARLRMAGREGDVFRIGVVCPDGFNAAGAPDFDVVVQSTESATRVPEFSSRCGRATRRAVVALRASNGPNLPVLYLGKPVAKTDASGAATVALDVRPGSDVELVLDTHAAKKIHPQNPVLGFKAEDKDDVVFLDQAFTVDKPAAVRVVAKGPTLARPLGGGGVD